MIINVIETKKCRPLSTPRVMEHRIKSKAKVSEGLIEKACQISGLEITMKAEQKSLPPNMHWHYKRGKGKGVLEITIIFSTNEIILSCKKNREAAWVLEVAKELRGQFF